MRAQYIIQFLTVVNFLMIVSCGIPDTPYLYPPEALTDQIGYKHDENNDADVFEGYEIYYRIYEGDVTDDQIEIDMNNYFNGNAVFSNISNEDYPDGIYYRRMVIKDSNEVLLDSIPHISVPFASLNQTFEVVLNYDISGYIEINLPFTSENYRGYRDNGAVGGSDNFWDLGEYVEGDEDFISGLELSALRVAFFAIPYGQDEINLNPIFANGTSEDMEYIGSLDLQQ